MRVIGITGPTGAGKSVVCKRLGDWERITVIDCDQVARDVVRRGQRCLLDLAVEFSSAIIDKDGELNRRRLAGIVFRDRKKLRRMEGIMYPYILDRIGMETAAREAAGDRAVFLDAPTLYQSGADSLCEKVAAVLAPEGDRLVRIMERDALSEEEARARMMSQPGDEFFEKRADYIIRNTGETSALRLQILELMNKLGL
ncbi:MAG: dephospho-CoA kinase [Angelakisella sp.]|jgi:dephospho-CoA kinase|nr:dephospho-CoA kinase [Angelakisella sp.]